MLGSDPKYAMDGDADDRPKRRVTQIVSFRIVWKYYQRLIFIRKKTEKIIRINIQNNKLIIFIDYYHINTIFLLKSFSRV